MSEDYTIVISDEPTLANLTRFSRMSEVSGLISDPLTPVADINRIIAGELAAVTTEIAELTQASAYRLNILKEQVKALRELAKTLTDNEVLSKKDILNFDGPKFQYVFQEITSNFKKAMKDSGLQETQTNEVLRNFRDIMASHEVELRKSTERVDSSFINK